MKELFNLANFDSYKEDNRREVKKAESGLPNSLWDTYSAFANCYGGVIILGVKENKDGSWYTTGLKNILYHGNLGVECKTGAKASIYQ